MATTPVPPVPPQPPQNATEAPPATVASAVGTFKSDLHQAAEHARQEFSQISATARADVQKMLADIEAMHGVSLSGLRKVLGY